MTRGIAVRLQSADRLRRKCTVGAAAVSDDLAVRWKLMQPLLELVERDRNRTGEVRRSIFLHRPHIDDEKWLARLQAGQQVLAADGFETFSRSQIRLDQALDARQS